MEQNEESGDMQPQPNSTPDTDSASFDEGFANFFNNETLSDRVLYICETEKVECYSGGAPCGRSKRKSDDVTIGDESLENSLFKRIKQEDDEDAGCSHNRSLAAVGQNRSNVEIVNTPLFQKIKVEDTEYDTSDVMEILSTSSGNPQQVDEHEEVVDDENTIVDEEAATENDVGDSEVVTTTTENDLEENKDSSTSVKQVENELRLDKRSEQLIEAEKTQEVSVTEEIDEALTLAEEGIAKETTHHFEALTSIDDESTTATLVIPKRTYTLETKLLKETRVFVHSIILAAKSEFFKCLFSTSGMKETNEQEVKLEVGRNETETLLTMLRCFYNRNHINRNSLDVVIKVCHMAMKYCFDGLIDKCLDVFANRSCQITEIEDFNRINNMIDKIKTGFNQHKPKCQSVQAKCHEFILKHFQKLDDCFETTPCKLFQLQLESMGLFINPTVQRHLCNQHSHGNMFLYVLQRWVKFHTIKHNLHADDELTAQLKLDTISFIEKLLRSVSLANVTTDFLTNVLNYEISSFNIWPGYKEWYIRALQNHLFSSINRSNPAKTFPVLSRQRELKYTRQEKNADIFSMTPVIVNGFEIGIYLRIREDRKVHMLCKCKNFFVNKVGFDKAVLTFSLKGLLKLNTNSTLWKEPFPRQFQSHPGPPMFNNDRFTFSYKQNTMCLQMYSLCKLSPAVYNIAKRSGFLIEFDIQQLH